MIDLEFYLGRHPDDDTISQEGKSFLGSVCGKGEFVTRDNGRRLYIRGYEAADNGISGQVRQVNLELEGCAKGIVELDASGIGRMLIPPDKYLSIKDNTLSAME